MAYRDESVAGRARLAVLERELCEWRAAAPSLARHRDALKGEHARLQHALTWYTNGERYGRFHRIDARDDLSPSPSLEPALPGVAELERALAGREARELEARELEATRELAALEPELAPRLERVRDEIRQLRAQCKNLRVVVDAFAARYPEHPPPPAWSPTWARAMVVTLVGVAGLALVWICALAWVTAMRAFAFDGS